jgi:MoaA/NifB/PqqE/SkfB family radical SAM enzyme
MDQVGDYVFFVDFYNWGEPLLNPHLEDFIQIAKSHDASSFVSTNLSLRLSDERIKRLLTCGVSEIGVSLDGASDETNQVYRRKSKFDLVVENMRRLVEARRRLGQTYPLISWLYVVFSFNEHEVEKARKMAKEIGVDRLVLRPPFLDANRYNLSEEDRRAIVTWAPKNPKFQIHVTKPRERKRCGWHYTALAVNWDGTVTPCSTAFRKSDDFGTFGKSGENPYFEVMNNSSFRAARDFMAGRSTDGTDVICARCPTKTIRHYHQVVYRQVAIITTVGLVESAKRLLRLRGTARQG